ncbi:MAG: hypothetical protein ACAH83_15930 [Alphaproteobacteria bacterium]
MSLREIFSRVFFRSPQERKEADLLKLQRKLARLMEDDRLGLMLENAMATAEARDGEPLPVKIEMVFKNLSPSDITAKVLENSHGFAYMQFVAEDAEAKLTFEVTEQKQRPYFWRDGENPAIYAKVTITIDLNQPYDESRIMLAEKAPVSSGPAAGGVRAQP